MKRFRSKWRSVLGLAEFEHKRALLEVARVSRSLRSLREQRSAFQSVLQSELEPSGQDTARALRDAYRASIARALRQKDLEIQRASAELGEIRQRMHEKQRRRDAMRSLRDKERSRWLEAAGKAEQQELEELARMRERRS